MGTLADIYSTIDSKRRAIADLLKNPVLSIEKAVGQMDDNAKERGETMQRAGWDVTSPSTATIEQQKLAQQLLADQGEQQAFAAMAIDPKAQRKLVEGLLGNGNQERYRLGDIKPKQAADAYNMGGQPVSESLDVFASPSILEDHARVRRMNQQNFSADDVGKFANQAMMPNSTVIPPVNTQDHAVLRSVDMVDPVTGQRYNAEMPLKVVSDGFEAVSIIPRGLSARKKPQ